jgi:hypothetical protein
MEKEISGIATSHDGAKLSYVYYPGPRENPLLLLSNGGFVSRPTGFI